MLYSEQASAISQAVTVELALWAAPDLGAAVPSGAALDLNALSLGLSEIQTQLECDILQQAFYIDTLCSHGAELESAGFALDLATELNVALSVNDVGLLSINLRDLECEGAGFKLELEPVVDDAQFVNCGAGRELPVARYAMQLHGYGYDSPPHLPQPQCERRADALARALCAMGLISAEAQISVQWHDVHLRQLYAAAQQAAESSGAALTTYDLGAGGTLLKFSARNVRRSGAAQDSSEVRNEQQ